MTKKRTSKFMKLGSLAVAAMMCLSLAVPAFASNLSITDDPSKPAQAAINKVLKMPIGTNVPDATFQFDFTRVSVDGETGTALNMPELPSRTVEFDSKTMTASPAGTGVVSVNKETVNIVDGVVWPHAGIYVYEVEESDKTNESFIDDEYENDLDVLRLSKAVYTVTVYIANDDAVGLYVYAIEAHIKANDDSNKGEPVGKKVNPTPDPDGDGSRMIFTNIYVRNNGGGGDPEDPDEVDPGTPGKIDEFTVLKIEKEVRGALGNREDKYFEFDVTVQAPVIGFDEPEKLRYVAYVMEMKGGALTVVTSEDNYDGTILEDESNYKYIMFTPDGEETVNLKHGQWLAFINLPVGSSYTAEEAESDPYNISHILTLSGSVGSEIKNASTGYQWVGELANKALYINTYGMTPPTGISADNLPYAILIVLAAVALAGYMALRFRRNAAQHPTSA